MARPSLDRSLASLPKQSPTTVTQLDCRKTSTYVRTSIDTALIANLARHVDCLAGLIGPRPLAKRASFEAAATYVERELANAGHKVSREVYAIGDNNVS